MLFFFASHLLHAQGPEAVAGVDFSLLLSYSGNHSWELGALYPFAGVQAGAFRLSAFGGAGFAIAGTGSSSGSSYSDGISQSWDVSWTLSYAHLCFGGNLEARFYPFLLGLGYGYEFVTPILSIKGGGIESAKDDLGIDESKISYPFIRAAVGINFGDILFFGDTSYGKLYIDYRFNDNGTKYGILFGFAVPLFGGSSRAPPLKPAPAPKPAHPTITSQELRRVELAYSATVRTIENRRKRIIINNASERSAFIRRWQGNPDTRQVSEAKNVTLPYYSTSTTSERDIVTLARQQPNDFLKVRMIHDWVSDIFIYDDDLLSYMNNVSGRNEEFTLWQIVQRQRGVCFEYAILFYFLLDAVGVDTYLISDHSEPGIGHAYNMVVINGTGYIIDTTWDSGNHYKNGRVTRFDRTVSKDYFMPGISQSYRLRRW